MGRVVDVRETTEGSGRAERGEKGLEVEKPSGQTVSREREMEKKGVRQTANTDGDIHRKTARQAIMQIGKTQSTLIKS